jgi:hypothetical protein
MKDCDSELTLSHEVPGRLRLVSQFTVTGAVWEVSTNSPDILELMQDEFQPNYDYRFQPDLMLCLYVDSAFLDPGTRVRPHFRAMEHLYYGTFGPADSMLVDQLNRRVVASLSASMVRDLSYWKRVILPCLVGITSACVGVAPVHCACVVKDGMGLLIHGESGAGKSTLALSLSLSGFSYLSDDCTYVSESEGELRCWGLSAPLKLLPESVNFFPRLSGLAPTRSLNGELALEFYPENEFAISRVSSCAPEWLVFIERTQESGADFRTISSAEATQRLAADLELLPSCIASQRVRQMEMIDKLVQRECRVLRHGLQPQALAEKLAEFCRR